MRLVQPEGNDNGRGESALAVLLHVGLHTDVESATLGHPQHTHIKHTTGQEIQSNNMKHEVHRRDGSWRRRCVRVVESGLPEDAPDGRR